MTRLLTICLAGSVLGGCALGTAIETSRVGDECIQHAYSRNIWWPNWDRVGVLEVDANGACQHRKEMHTATAQESFGQKAGKYFTGNLPIMGGLSMLRFQQSANTNLNINEHFSTKYIGK